MHMKRISIFLFFYLFFQSTFASLWTDIGNYSISWYDKSKKSFVINTPEELAGVAYLVNNNYTTFKNVTIVLGEDISLNEHEWNAIGTGINSCFQGIFDGNNHSIYDVRMSQNSFKDKKYMGFFTCLIDASVKNLYIQFEDFTLQDVLSKEINIGKIAGYAEDCEIRNVSTNGHFSWKTGKIISTINSNLNIGGLIGTIKKCTLYNCVNDVYSNMYIEIGSSNSLDYYKSVNIIIGGIVGHADHELNFASLIYGCENNAGIEIITGSSHNGSPSVRMGGIAGFFVDNTRIESCRNTAPFFKCKNKGNTVIIANIGGISGSNFTSPYCNGYIRNCYSSTTDITYGVWLHSKAYLNYGGISAIYETGTNNLYSSTFCPSDVIITPYNVGEDDIPLNIGFNSDNTFSADEMKSQEFLDMLNEYSIIQEGKKIWENKEIGKAFPSLIKNDNMTDIKSIMTEINTKPNYKISNKELTIKSNGKVTVCNVEGRIVYSNVSYQGESIKLEEKGIYIVKCNDYCFKISIIDK